jgi:hypothetical protein
MPVLLHHPVCLLLPSCYSPVIPPRIRSRTLHQYFRVPPAFYFISVRLFLNIDLPHSPLPFDITRFSFHPSIVLHPLQIISAAYSI